MPFAGNPREAMSKGLPFKLTDYIALIDLSGRIIREDKSGFIDPILFSILQRLNIESEQWVYLINHFESKFKSFIGAGFDPFD